MTDPAVYTMHLKIDYVLLRTLPPGIQRSSSDFQIQVLRSLRELFDELDGLIEAMSADQNEVSVTWKQDPAALGPTIGIVKLLLLKRYPDAILLLELFKSSQPDNPSFLYYLGMTYSDNGEFQRAVSTLHRLLEIDPKDVSGRVALGVALLRQGQDHSAEAELRRAVELDPQSSWAQRNLGACLLRLDKPAEALTHLLLAVELNPKDDRAWFGLGQAYELTGDLTQADAAYRRVLDLDEYGEAADQARQALSKLAQQTFRSVTPKMDRMDAVMYCLGALETYAGLSPDQVHQIGLEIAMLGMSGINVNDPTQKYSLRTLPGSYSGLHLLCLEFVAFKQFAPEMDIGFDLSAEYRAAQSIFQMK